MFIEVELHDEVMYISLDKIIKFSIEPESTLSYGSDKYKITAKCVDGKDYLVKSRIRSCEEAKKWLKDTIKNN